MAVSNTTSSIQYTTDGSTHNFAFPFYLYALADLAVQSILGNDPSSITEYFFGLDYHIIGTPDSFGSFPTGLTISFISAPPTGLKLLLTRRTSRSQLIQFTDNSPFTAESLNHALDKLTLMTQDLTQQFKGAAYGPPTSTFIMYTVGDWFINIVGAGLSLNQTVFGWMCILSGTPGVWKSIDLGAVVP